MDKIYLGFKVREFLPGLETKPISKVEILNDNGEIVGEAGDNSGQTLTATNPDGSNEMATSILEAVEGFVYKPFSANDAIIDPSAELGDGISVAGMYSTLIQSNIDFSGGMVTANISAPINDEIEDEYPYISPIERQIQRNYAATKSIISKTTEEILLEVEALDEDLGEKYTKLNQTVESFTFEDEDGTVKIDGGVVDASGLKVDAANVTGTLTIGQLPSSVAETSDIPSKVSQLTNDSGYQTKSGVTTIVNGTVTTDYINALDITATNISGGFIAGDNMQLDGELDVYEAITPFRHGGKVGFYAGFDGTDIIPGVAIKSGSPYNVCMATRSGAAISANGGTSKISVYGTTASIAANTLLYNGTAIHTSDKNVKHDINYDLTKYEAMYDSLKPCSFKMNYGTSGRDHTGFIAQDFKTAIKTSGLTTQECAAYVDIEEADSEEFGKCGIRYTEVVSLNTWQTQKLKARVKDLEEENAEIKSRLLKVEEKLTKMGV